MRRCAFLAGAPAGLVFAEGGEPLAVAPQLEEPLFARHGLVARTIPWADAAGHQHAFTQAFAELGLRGKRVAIEGGRMRYNECEILRAAGAELSDGDPLLNGMRMFKDASELAALRGAIQRSEAALEQTLSEVRVGMSEEEIGARLDAFVAGEWLRRASVHHHRARRRQYRPAASRALVLSLPGR